MKKVIRVPVSTIKAIATLIATDISTTLTSKAIAEMIMKKNKSHVAIAALKAFMIAYPLNCLVNYPAHKQIVKWLGEDDVVEIDLSQFMNKRVVVKQEQPPIPEDYQNPYAHVED